MPINLLDPLLTWLDENRDFNLADEMKAAQQLVQRQQAISDMMAGIVEVDYVLDLLEEQGLDAAEYADKASNNLRKVLNKELVIDPDDLSFYL